jgi:hypothetical protein
MRQHGREERTICTQVTVIIRDLSLAFDRCDVLAAENGEGLGMGFSQPVIRDYFVVHKGSSVRRWSCVG